MTTRLLVGRLTPAIRATLVLLVFLRCEAACRLRTASPEHPAPEWRHPFKDWNKCNPGNTLATRNGRGTTERRRIIGISHFESTTVPPPQHLVLERKSRDPGMVLRTQIPHVLAFFARPARFGLPAFFALPRVLATLRGAGFALGFA